MAPNQKLTFNDGVLITLDRLKDDFEWILRPLELLEELSLSKYSEGANGPKRKCSWNSSSDRNDAWSGIFQVYTIDVT
jgi:hypothetical protein